MERFDSFRLKHKNLGRDAFISKNPPLWLVRELLPEEGAEEMAKFSTVAINLAATATPPKPLLPISAAALLGRMRTAPTSYYVYPMAKRDTGSWQGRILVGRALNADLVLRHPSVSKLHAYFELDAQGQASLVDVRSCNGTLVDGQSIAKDIPVAIVPDVVVVFGSVRGAVISSGRLFDSM